MKYCSRVLKIDACLLVVDQYTHEPPNVIVNTVCCDIMNDIALIYMQPAILYPTGQGIPEAPRPIPRERLDFKIPVYYFCICAGAIGGATDLRFTGRGFESWLASEHHCVVALGKLLTPVCLCRQAI